MATIPLTRGLEAIVDDEDFERLSQHRWMACPHRSHWLVIALRRGRKLIMPRVILGVKNPYALVEHANGNHLDCRRSNLRVITKCQHIRRMPKRRSRRPDVHYTSRYKGVSFREDRQKWRATIKQRHLGYFRDELAAAQAYNEAAQEYFGESAYLNPLD